MIRLYFVINGYKFVRGYSDNKRGRERTWIRAKALIESGVPVTIKMH